MSGLTSAQAEWSQARIRIQDSSFCTSGREIDRHPEVCSESGTSRLRAGLPKARGFPYLALLAVDARTWSRRTIKGIQSTHSPRTFECGLLATLKPEAGRHRKGALERSVPVVAELKRTVEMSYRGYAK